jgi:hypothetical protein
MFSVAVEMENGERRTLSVRGESTGGVFQQVKAMPGVRRVGRVSAPGDERPANAGGGGTVRREIPPQSRPPVRPEQTTEEARRALIGHAISGPRVVLDARPSGGEQPFKHLQPPPERPKPPTPPPAPAKAAASKAAAPARPAATAAAAAPVTGEPEYRIVKSRRRDGQPYLLQRGHWQDKGGKRTFTVDWEQGFDTREAAEQHPR